MPGNPLLGNRISLISKKNIRYEGTLYSINESDATVALQDVKSFGTEGRELLDTTGASTFVPPNDVVHSYLLFRGQDIKDLHVHEKANAEAAKKQESSAEALEAEAAAVDATAVPLVPPAPSQAETAAPASEPHPVEKEKKNDATEEEEKKSSRSTATTTTTIRHLPPPQKAAAGRRENK